MIGKKVKINHGLYAGSEGTVKGKFNYGGQELYTIEILRQENDGEVFKATATCNISEFQIL